jgi:hypothetical protein
MEKFIKTVFAFSLMSGAFISNATERQKFHCMDDLIKHYQFFADQEKQSLPEFIDGQVKILSADFYANELNIEAYIQIKDAYLKTYKRSEAELKKDEFETQLFLSQNVDCQQDSPSFDCQRHPKLKFDQESPSFGFQGLHSFRFDEKEPDQILIREAERFDVQDESEIHLDHLLALRLQEEQDRLDRGAYILFPLTQKLTEEDIAIYEKIVLAAKGIKHDSDVHTMTKTFACPYYAETTRLEQKYLGIIQQHKALTLEEIEKDIQQLALRNKDIAGLIPPINSVFLLIRGYWNNPIDTETNVDIREVMSNCFLLARVYGDNALANLCHILADNIMTNGGCHPGVTGRLVHTYFVDVSASIFPAL